MQKKNEKWYVCKNGTWAYFDIINLEIYAWNLQKTLQELLHGAIFTIKQHNKDKEKFKKKKIIFIRN